MDTTITLVQLKADYENVKTAILRLQGTMMYLEQNITRLETPPKVETPEKPPEIKKVD